MKAVAGRRVLNWPISLRNSCRPINATLQTADIVTQWRRSVQFPPGLEAFLIVGSESGPPGADIDVKFTGASIDNLKQASLQLQEVLREMRGVRGVRDNTNYGREQLIFELSPTGTAVGLTEQSLGEQLRVAFEGEVIQIFQDQGEEIEVRLSGSPMKTVARCARSRHCRLCCRTARSRHCRMWLA